MGKLLDIDGKPISIPHPPSMDTGSSQRRFGRIDWANLFHPDGAKRIRWPFWRNLGGAGKERIRGFRDWHPRIKHHARVDARRRCREAGRTKVRLAAPEPRHAKARAKTSLVCGAAACERDAEADFVRPHRYPIPRGASASSQGFLTVTHVSH